MVYAPAAPGDERVVTVDVPEADRMRFCLDDADLVELARQALVIEDHYGCPMDIEWGKDGETGKLYILQARPGDRAEPRGPHACSATRSSSAARCS